MQMTIRGITPELRAALERRAEAEKKSLNQVVLDDLERAEGLGANGKVQKGYTDLDWFVGSGGIGAEELEGLKEFDRIDPEEWK